MWHQTWTSMAIYDRITWWKERKQRKTEEKGSKDTSNGMVVGTRRIHATGQNEGFGHKVLDSDGTGGKTPPASAAPWRPQRQPCPTSETAPSHFLFSYPFSSCHSKCYSQLVKVHYTLSSWPEIYAPQRLRRAREGCNPLRLMTVHVSRQEAWIFLTRLGVD